MFKGIKDALEYACLNGHETLVKYFVEQGVDVQRK
jgi:ankyrin repeat protein